MIHFGDSTTNRLEKNVGSRSNRSTPKVIVKAR